MTASGHPQPHGAAPAGGTCADALEPDPARARTAFAPGLELLDHPYGRFIESLEKPARYVGAEHGAVRKRWDGVRHRICLAFPDVYEIGASHLGIRILYRIVNALEDALAERCFCPWIDLEAELRDRGLPLVSLEGRRPLTDFDVVGFSLQYELTFTNILTMLDLGRIALRTAHRSEAAPLVLGGGPGAMHPEPVADFFDAFVLGDGEQSLMAVARCWVELREQGRSRAERLRALAQLDGVYVPSLYRTAIDPAHGRTVASPLDSTVPFPVRRTTAPLDQFPFPSDGPVGGPEAIFDRVSIEIARGCDQGCRFCQAGMIYRPMRERSAEGVAEVVRAAVRHSGTDELSLTALSPADVSTLGPLLCGLGAELSAEGVALGVSSLRAYGLAPEVFAELRRLRAAGLTLAPEAGSQRLRDVVNKNVTAQQLCDAVERAATLGWTRLKLYFMIGLPTETDDDVRDIVRLAADVARAGRRAAGRRVAVTVSVSTFVPKPHTPLQWESMAPAHEIERKQQLLRAAMRSERTLTLRVHAVRTSVLEGALCRGGRALAPLIETAWRLGARFDSWDDQLRLELWEQAFAAHERSLADELEGFPVGGSLPWGHLEAATTETFLRRERNRALLARPSPPCGRLGRRDIVICYRCGAGCAHAPGKPNHPTPAPPHPVELGTDEANGTARTKPLPAQRRRGGPPEGQRVRFELQKLGAAALLSHLDLVRELPRVLRRAGARMALTTGFHPKPAMSFGPALALGVPSLQEYLDIRLLTPRDEAGLRDLVPRLCAACPEGLRILSAVPLPDEEPAVGRRIRIARYAVVLDGATAGPASALGERLAQRLALPSITVPRGTGSARRPVELRPSLLRAEVAQLATTIALDDAHIAHGGPVIEVDVALGPGPCPKPVELGPLLLDLPAGASRAVRVRLLPASSDGDLPVLP